MKFSNILSSFILVLLVMSCSQFGDSFRLPGEKSKEIQLSNKSISEYLNNYINGYDVEKSETKFIIMLAVLSASLKHQKERQDHLLPHELLMKF